MRTGFLVIALAVGASLTTRAQNPNQMFGRALTGINAINTASIVYSGTGTASVPASGSALRGKAASPSPVTKYTVAINYGLLSSRTEIERKSSPKRVAMFLSEGTAWDVRDGKKAVPVPSAAAERERQIWMTPHGIMKAAQDPASKRTMATEAGPDGKMVTTMTFTAGGSQLKAYLDDAAMITRVQTMPGDPVLGNTIVELLFSDYKDYDTTKPPTTKPPGAGIYTGIPFPSHIVEKRDGQIVLDLTLTEVRPNAGLYLEVPESVQKAAARK